MAVDAAYWAAKHVEPAGAREPGSHGAPPPTEATLAIMRSDPMLRAEFELYDFANDVLDCKLRACGIVPG